MLQSIKQLYGSRLGAADGEIGEVKDFYFDDQNWAIRYVIAETGNWLNGRQVLISPHAFSRLTPVEKVWAVKLTRKQIEDSPAIETHRPVSRQYEMDYHRYYGWPFYWEGDGLWGGTRGFPVLDVPVNHLPGELAKEIGAQAERADAHLRSTQSVSGYHLQATDGIIGHVGDYLVNPRSWAIEQLIVKTGHRFSGKDVLVPRSEVSRISYEDSTVFVKSTREAVEKSPAYHLVPALPAITL